MSRKNKNRRTAVANQNAEAATSIPIINVTSKEDTVNTPVKTVTPTVITLTIPKFDRESIRAAVQSGVQKVKSIDYKKVGNRIGDMKEAVKNVDHQKGRVKLGNFLGGFSSAINDIKTGIKETNEKNKNNLSK